jgi:hypothetical protein
VTDTSKAHVWPNGYNALRCKIVTEHARSMSFTCVEHVP